MGGTTKDRRGSRADHFRRNAVGTHKAARSYQAAEQRLLALANCPTCGAPSETEPTMCGSQHADGQPLVYYRCPMCRLIFSRLTKVRESA